MNLLRKLLLLLLMKDCLCIDLVPVFILDIEGIASKNVKEPNPFLNVETKDFYNTIRTGLRNYEMAVVFVENDFSVEHISTKDSKGTPFFHLRQRILSGQAKYMPAVRQPYETIASIIPPLHKNTFYLKEATTLNLSDGLKYLYVHFQDVVNETRASALRRHDSIIDSVYRNSIKTSSGPLLALYTGMHNPYSVEHIDISKDKKKPKIDPDFIVESNHCLLSFHGFSITGTGPTRRHSYDNLPKVTSEMSSNDKLSTRVFYMDYELQFDFHFSSNNWVLESVGLLEEGEEIGRTKMSVGAPYNCAYSCSDPLIIINERDGSSVTISQYKIQPFHKKPTRRNDDDDDDTPDTPDEPDTADDTPTPAPAPGPAPGPKGFGDTIDCGPYFSAPIISALTIVFICLGTFLYFVTLMMSCHTNDRYDDANAKPLVIGVQGL